METIRGILAAHPGGISRAGILAWAKLRIDPDFDEARLDAELAALAPEIVDRDGFLSLGSSAGAPGRAAPGSEVETDPGTTDTWPESRPAGPSAPGAIEGWRAPGDSTGWPVPSETETEEPALGRPGEGSTEGEAGGPAIPGWAAPSGRRRTRTATILGLTIGAAVLVANLIGLLGTDSGSWDRPDPTGPRATVTGSLGPYEDLAVGDCLAVPTAEEFDEVVFVSCAAPHDGEVFFVGERPGSDDEYPDAGAFEAYVDETCLPAFEAYTGSAFDEQSTLDMGWFTPTEPTWSSGYHTVLCYLTPVDGSTTSVSYRGAHP